MRQLRGRFPPASTTPKVFRNVIGYLGFLFIVLFGSATAKADPLTIVGLQGGFFDLNTNQLSFVDLTANPNHTFTFTGPIIGYPPDQTSYVSFRVQISGITGLRSETVHISFTQTGGNSPMPPPIDILNVGAFGPTNGYAVSAPFFGGYYEGAPFSLAFAGSININIRDNLGQVVDSISASFMVNRVIPAPEPATLLLLGTGMAGVAAKVYRRRSVGKRG